MLLLVPIRLPEPLLQEGEPAHADSIPIDPVEASTGCRWIVYTGGIEHATMHLIYTRFFTKAMRDMGMVDFDEPMTVLRNQGIILGEDSEKMSKSRGNVVAPDDLVQQYGADTVRGYLMFGWRWEQGGPWDSTASRAWSAGCTRVWNLVLDAPASRRVDKPADERRSQTCGAGRTRPSSGSPTIWRHLPSTPSSPG